ncbi:MAG TPA: hypothetical protein VJB87_05390 [Candidatus Nanoarchaeia archaeon]|nr:hypothetical protein [Candidatus Nanoarchaeia archaeon]
MRRSTIPTSESELARAVFESGIVRITVTEDGKQKTLWALSYQYPVDRENLEYISDRFIAPAEEPETIVEYLSSRRTHSRYDKETGVTLNSFCCKKRLIDTTSRSEYEHLKSKLDRAGL